ncbi:MAG: JAB domain-containing protein [Desulfobacterales bacterium]|nr:JAB domain-containing protein [Desulfobacterales bacterium]
MAEKTPHKGTGHRGRLRERFLAGGLQGFHDYEVIELLLTLATPRKDCKQSAKAALQQFGSLQAVMEASPETLEQVPGIGPRNQLGIRLVKAVADRYLKKKVIGRIVLNNSRELFDFLYHSMRDKSQECFKVVFLDAKNRVIEVQTLFKGTLTASAVYPREVVKAALEKNAAALIFAHNHPSGEPEPSSEDMEITRQLVFACRVVGVTVHEHLIIGDNRYFSFADQGHMLRMNREFEAKTQGSQGGRT